MAKGEASMVQKLGSWAFIIGIIIAVIAGLASQGNASPVVTSVLIVLGLIVGFLNVTGKETTMFLLAGVALVIVTSFGGDVIGQVQNVGGYLQGVFGSMMTFVIPAVIVVSLKAIWALAAEE